MLQQSLGLVMLKGVICGLTTAIVLGLILEVPNVTRNELWLYH
jgi:hypothetical protein